VVSQDTRGSCVARVHGWLFINDLNLAYWSGHRGKVDCTLTLLAPRPDNAPPGWPGSRNPRVCAPH
jgi:hypothetical protein